MSNPDPVYIGIDPASSHKEFRYSVLDRDLNLLDIKEADTENLVTYLTSLESALVAINAPSGLNRGLVRATMTAQHPLDGHKFRGVDIRLAEFELRQLGISISGTPAQPELCTSWMRSGFALIGTLKDKGYQAFPAVEAPLQWLETHPHAAFCALLERTPFAGPTLEGRLQRQLVLHARGLRITDPIDFFEEITRFKLLNGILPLEAIYSSEELDVLVAAYTAWAAFNQAENVTRIGDAQEGLITLPVRALKDRY